NVLCIGAVGTGKTHLAIALGVKACMQGKAVRFYRAVDLATELADRRRDGSLARLQKQLAALDLLIIDELGYIPFERVAVKAGTKCPKTVGAKFPKNAGLKNPQPQLSSCIGAG